MKIGCGLRKLIKVLLVWVVNCILLAGGAVSESLTESNSPDSAELSLKATAVLDYLELYGKDDYDIIYGVYNYICQTVTYDWSAIDNFPWDGESVGCGQTAYEALCQEEAVCAGISRAITLLLEKMNVSCKTVIGHDPYGMGHAWNLVQLNGQWYFMDATFDLGCSTYTKFLKCWEDFGTYVVWPDSGFDIADYNLAGVSYVGNVESQRDSYEGFVFNMGLSDITIFAYQGAEKDLVIPAEIKGRKVKRLAQDCILQNDDIETLIVSEGIERLDSLFVGHCSKLKSISLPSTVRLTASSSDGIVTGVDGFVTACSAMETVLVDEGNPYLCVIDNALYNTEMTELIYYPAQCKAAVVHIPEGVLEIRGDTFVNNTYLKEIVLPESIVSIGYWAFEGCTNLEKAEIPPNCTSIGQYAFARTKLSEVHIPAATTSIASNAFSTVMRHITVDEDNPVYYAVDDVLFTYDGKLQCYPAMKPDIKYVIPDVVTTIDLYAFENACNLVELELPQGLKKIEAGAFSRCSKLQKMVLPDSVTYLGDQAFFDCLSLRKLLIPESVKTIDAEEFLLANVKGLVIWGKTGSAAHEWAERYGYVFQDMDQEWDVSGTCGDNITWTLSEEGILSIFGTGEMGACNPAPWVSYSSMIVSVVMADGITSIADEAFYECYNLVSVDIPESVVSLGNRAFAICSSLESITIPNSVKMLGSGVAWLCTSLKTAKLPDGISMIPSSMFSSCESLVEVEIPETVWNISGSAFSYCTSLASISIPAKVEYLGPRLFEGCTMLKEVKVPDKVNSLDEMVFYGCESLVRVELPPQLTAIGTSAFEGCSSLSVVVISSQTMPTLVDETFAGLSPTIYCYVDSEVESWAVSNGFTTMPIGLLDFDLPETSVTQMNTTISLEPVLSDENAAYLAWYVSDQNVAMVHGNQIIAVDAGITTVRLSYEDKVLDEMTIIVIGKDVSSIPGVSHFPGDVSGDGYINTDDALSILQCIVDEDIEGKLDLTDVNEDDLVDIQDALLILQFNAGWSVVLQ